MKASQACFFSTSFGAFSSYVGVLFSHQYSPDVAERQTSVTYPSSHQLLQSFGKPVANIARTNGIYLCDRAG